MGRPANLLAIAAFLTLAGIMWCAAHGNVFAINAIALVFALAAIWTAWRVNAPRFSHVKQSAADWPAAATQLKATSLVTASVYAWGGLAMLLVYELTQLHWRHGWQYGSLMLLIAGGLLAYVRALKNPSSRLASPSAVERIVQLAAVHGIAAAVALGWLVLSGKLMTYKGDWAANAIFLAGGLAIVFISAIAVATHRRLTRPSF